ncbi:hypothetical protein EVAR_97465_1 [Eumeta japonica]|uniref:Uncharacterized protein n=1 Tax=Eumeta variegata TaxID=151549 RepID=A0A4C1WYP8_EUMVA|nr:hypothetical protein EVAR_97465_1 [Eumeta japonica]
MAQPPILTHVPDHHSPPFSITYSTSTREADNAAGTSPGLCWLRSGRAIDSSLSSTLHFDPGYIFKYDPGFGFDSAPRLAFNLASATGRLDEGEANASVKIKYGLCDSGTVLKNE